MATVLSADYLHSQHLPVTGHVLCHTSSEHCTDLVSGGLSTSKMCMKLSCLGQKMVALNRCGHFVQI